MTEQTNQKTIGIIQITRIGDILQTYIAAKTLKEQRPEVRIILIARKQFVTPLTDIISDGFDAIYPIDCQDIFSTPGQGLTGAKKELNNFLKKISNENLSVLVNLSFGKTSSYLSSIIETKFRLGPFSDNNANIIINDYWSQYVYSNVMGGPLCPFNLVDIYKSILGVEFKNIEKQSAVSQIDLSKNIYIHPFASHSKKKWKVSKWIEFCYKILKDNPKQELYIVGSKDEVDHSIQISTNPLLTEFKSRIHNITGQTTIQQLYLKLKRDCSLFIGHDSMVGHLAAIADVRTVTISLGTTRPNETTPYSANNYNISPKTNCYPCFPTDKCEYYQCHADISYSAINMLTQELITNGKLTEEFHKNIENSFQLNSVDISKSIYSENGLLKLQPTTKNPLSLKDIFRSYYRISWYFLFSSKEESGGYPELNKNTHQQLLNYIPGIQHLYELAEFGKKYSKYILQELASDNPNMQQIKDYGTKIDEIDNLTSLIKTNYPMLSPIIDYFTVVKSNLSGENIVELTQSSYLCYEDCASVCSIIYEFIEKTITEHKINNQRATK